MVANTDAIRVAAPAWHAFMQAALDHMGIGDEWYFAATDVVARDGAYLLAGT